jgi:predicted DNA-binding ribbon-helix-helix protein
LSRARKRSVAIRGHRTSFSVEDPFYEALEEMARERGLPFAALIAHVDAARPRDSNLSSALRVAVLEWVKSRQGA